MTRKTKVSSLVGEVAGFCRNMLVTVGGRVTVMFEIAGVEVVLSASVATNVSFRVPVVGEVKVFS